MEQLFEQAGEMTVLISSHELGEIDSVATHVGFLDEGNIAFRRIHDRPHGPLQPYRAQVHFTRTLIIPDVRLEDWEAAAPNP